MTKITKAVVVAVFALATAFFSTTAFAQGGCVYFPIPAEYQNPNATNVYRVASGANASGAPVTTTPISTDNTLGTTITQPVTVPTGQGPFSICAPAGAYTLQFNTSLGGGGFFNYNIFIPPDITAMSATTSKIVDPTDNTKVIKFQASGATASTTLTLADTLAASRTVTFTDPGGAANVAYANPTTTQTLSATNMTTPTLTTPVIATGLTASGSASNDFSASTGTFKTSTGAVTIGNGAVGITGQATFSAGILASGATANDFSGSTGTFKTSTGVNTFGGSSNSFSGAVTITPTASLVLGTSGSAVGQLILNNATTGTVTLNPATGALGTESLSLPVNPGGLPVVESCGSTGAGNQTCSVAAVTAKTQIYVGESTLAANAANITFPNGFTSSTSYFCVANDVTTRANPVQMIPSSGTVAAITNTTGATDVIQWVCVGN